ncbi:uncharacterized protein JCM6883_004695 [Sporobolomyces salmoneus]|uniref:uncharacterized protein n=1 Tax=Sporobolomyces salmoneus TaxID=183962 RepID=UPI00316F7314
MSTDTYQHTFNWKGHGNTVIATGSFDDWKTSLPPLNRQPDGTFSGQIGVAYGQKIVYKYVVDGQWMHNVDEQTETDSSGNVNNVFNVPERSEVSAPASTDAVLPVPESVSTVSGNVSSSEPATTSALPQSTESQTTGVTQKASDLVGQAQQQASETAGQVQQKSAETVQAAKEKVDEVVPQVKETLSGAAQTTKEHAAPVAITAATAGAAVVAAGVATVIGATGSDEDKATSSENLESVTQTRSLSASATPFVPGGEKPQAPSPTPLPSSDPESVATIPSNSFIGSKVPEEDIAHSTAVAPKESSTSTAAAPVYDEKTAVVAKDGTAPESISTPLGNTAQASAELPKENEKKEEGEPFPEPAHVEGLVAPADHPSDAPIYAAGIAALGALGAGATILGEKVYHAALPHAQHAAETVSQQTTNAVNVVSESSSKAINEAPQIASNSYNSVAQSTSNAVDSASKSIPQAANAVSETGSNAYQQITETAGKGLESVRNTSIGLGGAVLGAVGLGGAAAAGTQKEEEVTSSSKAPNDLITPLPVSEAPEGPTVPDQVLTSLPVSEAPVASTTSESTSALAPPPSTSTPASSSAEAPTLPDKEISPLPASEAPIASSSSPSTTPSAPLPVPKESSIPHPVVAKDSAPVDAAPVSTSQSLRPEPVVSTPTPVVSTPAPVVTDNKTLPPPVAVQEPPSVAHDGLRTRESSVATNSPSTFAPETPVKSGQQQTPFSTAPSTPAPAPAPASKSSAQEALGQGRAGPGEGSVPSRHQQTASVSSVADSTSPSNKKKDGRRASGFFSRLFGKKEQQ